MAYDFNSISPYLTQLAGGNKTINSALQAGGGLADTFYPTNALGRLNETNTGSQSAINRYQTANKAPTQPLKLGSALRTLKKVSGQASMSSPWVQSNMKDYGQVQQNAFATDPRNQNVLNENYDLAMNGLDARTAAALREQSYIDLNRGKENSLRQMRQGNYGAVGAAAQNAANSINNQYLQSRGDLSRQLLTDQIGIQQQARSDFMGQNETLRSGEFNRQLSATQAENQALTNAIQQDYNLRQGYAQTLQNQQLQNDQIKQGRLANLANAEKVQRDELLQRQIFNLGNLEKEISGRLGLIFGSGSFGAAQYAQEQANQIARESLSKL